MPTPSLINLEKRFRTFGEYEQSGQASKLSNHIFFSLDFTIGKTNKMNFNPANASGHITLNTPVLVRSPKLSNVESSQYLDGWPPGNTGCCWLTSAFLHGVCLVFAFARFCLVFSQDFSTIFVAKLWKSWRKKSWKEKSEKKGRKPTASSVPRRSPIQVLTGLNVA